MLRNFYVDDCLKSVRTEEDGINLVKDLCDLLDKGGFKLTKWISNNRHVLQTIPEERKAKGIVNVDLDYDVLTTQRALGVYWNIETDCFSFTQVPKKQPLTRRGLLSVVSSVYDPLGMISPFILTAKKIMQNLTREKIAWDDILPSKEMKMWITWQSSLPLLKEITVTEYLEITDTAINYELHHFSDASEIGYGSVSYLRVTDNQNNVRCALMMSRSRLAPLKITTIPRLELSAATLSVKLDVIIRRELDCQIDKSVFWTDSTIVLGYIKNVEKRFRTFVANRITLIHSESTLSQWQHIDTGLNPADDVSRGLTTQEMIVTKMV